ncbi:hypothetical protein BJF78_14280 [Pseudonocardia sp. CNS-139]|nr:hypothetical protein BJF78_14280 [Pseudonocardia sp. CNS-139]
MNTDEHVGVTETRLVHDVHRVATAMLVRAALRPATPPEPFAEVRAFLVATLRHHHETEDGRLWPLLLAADPQLATWLDALSGQHEELDAALDALACAPLPDGTAPLELSGAATAVRDLVHAHLDLEEALLLPAVRAHLGAAEWEEFSAAVVATSPADGAHLMVGFLDRVAGPQAVRLALRHLPGPVQVAVPAMRELAATTISALDE